LTGLEHIAQICATQSHRPKQEKMKTENHSCKSVENKIIRLKNFFILQVLHLIYSTFQNHHEILWSICFVGERNRYVQNHKESNKTPKQCISGFHGKIYPLVITVIIYTKHNEFYSNYNIFSNTSSSLDKILYVFWPIAYLRSSTKFLRSYVTSPEIET